MFVAACTSLVLFNKKDDWIKQSLGIPHTPEDFPTHSSTQQFTECRHKGLFTNYVISKLTYMVLKIMTQHDAIYLVGSLIMMND